MKRYIVAMLVCIGALVGVLAPAVPASAASKSGTISYYHPDVQKTYYLHWRLDYSDHTDGTVTPYRVTLWSNNFDSYGCDRIYNIDWTLSNGGINYAGSVDNSLSASDTTDVWDVSPGRRTAYGFSLAATAGFILWADPRDSTYVVIT